MNRIIQRSLAVLPVALLAIASASAIVACHRDEPAKATGMTELTAAGTLDRDAPLVPRNHRDLAFYSARTQGESQTKVFVQRTTGEPLLVYVDPEPGELISVSDDGAHGVYRRFIAPGMTANIAVDFQTHQS